jgi:hypothetical protein
MKALFHLASEIQTLCVSQKWRFCFIGGIALQRWGEPRLTVDVDVSLLTGFGNEEQFVDVLCQKFLSRIDNVREFALQNRVLLLKSNHHIPIDIALAGLPFEECVIDRATEFSFLRSITLRTCSAEDLIIYKAFADRNRDWADIEGILIRQKNKLDWKHIEKYLIPLCELKESPHILPKLIKLKSETSL